MNSPLIELLFTTAACMSLGMLFIAAAMVLPWREEELNEVSDSLSRLAVRAMSRPAEALRRAV